MENHSHILSVVSLASLGALQWHSFLQNQKNRPFSQFEIDYTEKS